MFESAELGHSLDKTTFESALPALRAALLDAKYELVEKRGFQVILVISGVNGEGGGSRCMS